MTYIGYVTFNYKLSLNVSNASCYNDNLLPRPAERFVARSQITSLYHPILSAQSTWKVSIEHLMAFVMKFLLAFEINSKLFYCKEIYQSVRGQTFVMKLLLAFDINFKLVYFKEVSQSARLLLLHMIDLETFLDS